MSRNSVPHTAIPRQSPEKCAAVYVRVSTSDQADKGYSLPTQIEACLDLAEREGYVVPPEISLWREALCCLREREEKRKDEQHDTDKLRGIGLWNTIVQRLREQHGALTASNHVFVEDFTGMSLNRPQLTKLRDLVHQRLVQAVFVHDIDRLSRKLAHQLLLGEEFEQASVVLRVVSMPDGAKTPEAQLLSHVRGIIAEYERAKILERTARGRRGRAQAGHVTYGGRTLGYAYVKHADKGAHYEVHPEEAALVRRIFRLCVEDGLSTYAIAQLLTKEGVLTPLGQRRTLSALVWHPSTIASILRNTAYVGSLHEGKTQRLPGKKNPDKKTRVRRVPREDWIPIAVPPIIDPATFEAAEAQLQRNKRQARRNRKYEYLLVGGRLRCGQCDSTMSGGNKQGIPYYLCGRKPFQDAAAPHTKRSIQAKEIEPLIWQAVERALNDPTVITAELDRRKKDATARQADLDRERQQYLRQLAQCDKDLKRWEAAYLGEAIDLDDFKTKKAEVDARRASAGQELARLGAEQSLMEQAELETAFLVEYCARARANLQHFTMEEKRRVLAALNITVKWEPEKEPDIKGSIEVRIVTIAS
jgi:site-specific DNA recombinase